MMCDVIQKGEVVFTGTFKEADKYVDAHIDEPIVVVDHGGFTADGALNSLKQLKAALEEAGTFGWYAGDYELVKQFIEKVGEQK